MDPAAGGRPFPLPNVSVVEQLTGEVGTVLERKKKKKEEDRVPPMEAARHHDLSGERKRRRNSTTGWLGFSPRIWHPVNNQPLSNFCQEMLLLAGPAAA